MPAPFSQSSLHPTAAPNLLRRTGSAEKRNIRASALLPQATRGEVLQIAREADKLTNSRSGMTRLQQSLQALATHEVDPSVQRAINLQAMLMESYLMGPMRNPKVVESALEPERIYANVSAEATEVFLFGCEVGASVLHSRDDNQRCAVNLGADACLIGVDGGLGISGPLPAGLFVNAVRTSVSDKLVTIQAQGPKSADQVSKLLMAATRHAASTGCERVIFVNASTDKVPSFGQAVQDAKDCAVPMTYRELHWIDGEVPQTEAGRAAIVNFVRDLGREVLAAEGRTMVVFNCHIGLDRSGVTNALTQLVVDHACTPDNLTAAHQVLKNIKRARPHGVSTVFRFHLIMQCLKDLRAPGRLMPVQ